MTECAVVRVVPALRPLEELLVSKRHARAARRWPWAWYCTVCEGAYGAGRTEQQAREAAEAHAAAAHQSGKEAGR